MAAQTPIVLISGRPQRLAAVDTVTPAALPPLTGDASTVAGAMALTLATVNANVGTFNGLTVNGKGLVTAATTLPQAAEVIPLLQVQTAVTSTATTAATATLIDASNFLWNTGYIPSGRSVYLEILGSATAGSPVAILTALGATTAIATVTGTASLTTVRTSSAAITTLVSGTEYQIRLFNSVAGTASLKVARIIVI